MQGTSEQTIFAVVQVYQFEKDGRYGKCTVLNLNHIFLSSTSILLQLTLVRLGLGPSTVFFSVAGLSLVTRYGRRVNT